MKFAPALNVCSKCATIRQLKVPTVQSATLNIPPSTPLTYQIVADQSPTNYSIIGLFPSGLSIDHSTGVISGTIASPTKFTYTIEISATNAKGTGTGFLTINVKGAFVANFAFTNNGASNPLSAFEVSLDGGAYQTASFNTDYKAATTLKYRTTVRPATWTNLQFVILPTFTKNNGITVPTGLATIVGTIGNSGTNFNVENDVDNTLKGIAEVATNGNLNLSQVLPGGTGSAPGRHLVSFNTGGASTVVVTSCILETTLNLV